METQNKLFDMQEPEMTKLDLSRCSVVAISRQTAASMVRRYHYAHRVPFISYAYGMYVDGVLAGCITYGMPASSKARAAICGKRYEGIVYELNRLYCHEWVGRNSESWLIGQSFRLLPRPLILVSYADTGERHVGYIYQATNWLYTGLSDASGCYSKIEIGGKERASKSMYNELGTQAKSAILEKYPDAVFHEYTRKHRYVYFLGTKHQRKEMRGELRYDAKPYPKE